MYNICTNICTNYVQYVYNNIYYAVSLLVYASLCRVRRNETKVVRTHVELGMLSHVCLILSRVASFFFCSLAMFSQLESLQEDARFLETFDASK